MYVSSGSHKKRRNLIHKFTMAIVVLGIICLGRRCFPSSPLFYCMKSLMIYRYYFLHNRRTAKACASFVSAYSGVLINFWTNTFHDFFFAALMREITHDVSSCTFLLVFTRKDTNSLWWWWFCISVTCRHPPLFYCVMSLMIFAS